MPAPRAKKKREGKKTVLTASQYRAMKTEALGQCFLLTAAYLMEEMEKPAEEICELWDGVARYAEAVDKKYITMERVCKILSEHTGLDVHWNGTFNRKG